MSKFIVSDFFKFIPHSFEVEGVEFELITLTDELVEEVMQCTTYADMLSLAADSGLACDNERILDDERLSPSIERLWKDSRVDIGCEPSVKHQVGLKVCEISDLSEFIEEQELKELAAEEEKAKQETIVNEDFIAANGETDLHQIHQDNVAAG